MALVYTQVINASLFNTAIPAMIIFLCFLLKIEKTNKFQITGLILSVFGILSIITKLDLTILLSLITARFLNGYNTKLYSLKTTISVKEETNPLFSSGTNLTFNWGGASDIIETVNIILRSRTHNEKVVTKLQFYMDYLKDGKYRFEDVYGETPFKVIVDEKNFQLYQH